MKKTKVMTIVGTRPELIRLSVIIKKLDEAFDHVFVHTGQNWDYSLNEIFFQDLSIRTPNHFLNVPGKTLGETMGNIIAKSYEIMTKEQPDAVLVLGDTNSALSTISAKRLKIPIFHMEAGNRCWDWNVSEMINRKIVDHISDINLPYTEHARRYLISEGIDPKTIFVTGSPLLEVIMENEEKIKNSLILDKLCLEKNKYFVLSAHREENIDNPRNFHLLMSSVNDIAQYYGIPIIFSVHPRSKKYIVERDFKFNTLIHEITPLSFSDYVCLQKNAYCVLSDSGTLSEESAIMNFPAVQIRTSTERPEAIDKGKIIIGGLRTDEIIEAINISTKIQEHSSSDYVSDYSVVSVSDIVIRLIASYTKIVNITTWRKDD